MRLRRVQLRGVLALVSLLQWTHPASAAELDDVAYRALVERVKGGDLSVDFRALRLACMKASRCEPRGSKDDLGVMGVPDLGVAVQVAEKLIEDGFVNLEAHATAAGMYRVLNEPEKANTHLAITQALLRSIMGTADGKTKESAYEVICDREMYVVLSALGLPAYGPDVSVVLLTEGPHKVEKYSIKDPKTGRPVEVFFNIDAFTPERSFPR